jgi:kinesin family protein 5
MRDLQNRCEKVRLAAHNFVREVLQLFWQVVELEIQLDEIREQYNNVIRNSNSKAQQKKMAFLERNLEQLTLVQKQVSASLLKRQQWGGVSAVLTSPAIAVPSCSLSIRTRD